MLDSRFFEADFDGQDAERWVTDCAIGSGWSRIEADRLARAVSESAAAVSRKAYRLKNAGPVFVRLDIAEGEARLELHHEGALGDRPCECKATQAAKAMISSDWCDAQLRTHALTIAR